MRVPRAVINGHQPTPDEASPPMPDRCRSEDTVIGLDVPGRPIRSPGRRGPGAEASATKQDRTLGPYWVRDAPRTGTAGAGAVTMVTSSYEEPQVGTTQLIQQA